jgi:phosphopantetheinyl transferase
VQALQLSSNNHGKPRLESARGLHFSVAHTQGALLCAVTLDGDVGVDIELRNRVDDKPSSSVERLAQRYFSADEHAALCALPDDASKRARFVELWTLKEAYVKALGRGIAAAPLAGFSMRVARASGSSLVGRIHLEHGVSSHFAPELYTRATHAGQQTELCGWHFWLLNLCSQTTEGDGGIGDDHVAAVCAPCIAPNRSPLLRCWRALPTVHERSVHLAPVAEGRTATACAAT